MKLLSRVRLFATPWTEASQAPPSMGFSRQEYWTGLPFPSPEDLPNSGIKPGSPALQADTLLSKPIGASLVAQRVKQLPAMREAPRSLIYFNLFAPSIGLLACLLHLLQSCLTLCDFMNCNPPGFSVHVIFQARILEWVAMPFSRGSSRPRARTHISGVSCICRWFLYHWCHLGSPNQLVTL